MRTIRSVMGAAAAVAINETAMSRDENDTMVIVNEE